MSEKYVQKSAKYSLHYCQVKSDKYVYMRKFFTVIEAALFDYEVTLILLILSHFNVL